MPMIRKDEHMGDPYAQKQIESADRVWAADGWFWAIAYQKTGVTIPSPRFCYDCFLCNFLTHFLNHHHSLFLAIFTGWCVDIAGIFRKAFSLLLCEICDA